MNTPAYRIEIPRRVGSDGAFFPSDRKMKRNGTKIPARLTARRQDGGFTSRTGRRARVEVGLPFFSAFFSSAGSSATSLPSSSSWTYSHSCRLSFSRRRRCFLEGMSLRYRAPTTDDRVDAEVAAQVVREIPPVRDVEQQQVGVVAGCDPSL